TSSAASDVYKRQIYGINFFKSEKVSLILITLTIQLNLAYLCLLLRFYFCQYNLEQLRKLDWQLAQFSGIHFSKTAKSDFIFVRIRFH
ncbi:hypothetical protein KQJ29_31855, partial [Enterococcus sp. S181_ASV_20]|nr:hypothetical protein [Enterococcus sp. S181_ASV_20]